MLVVSIPIHQSFQFFLERIIRTTAFPLLRAHYLTTKGLLFENSTLWEVVVAEVTIIVSINHIDVLLLHYLL